MRILVTSTPGVGHLHPIVPLAQELASVGHEIVWATAPESCAKVESYGFRAAPAGMDAGTRNAAYRDRAPDVSGLPARERRAVSYPFRFGEIAAPVMRGDLLVQFDEFSPDLVIQDAAELAAAPIAVARGIPHVTIGFSGANSDTLQAAVLESVAPLWATEGCTPNDRDFNGELLLHPFPTAMDTPRPDGPSQPLRPLSFDGAAFTSPPEWIVSFGGDRPGVYVTFGTVSGPLAPWAAVFAGLADLDVDVVATVGDQVDPAQFGTIPPNTRVERYLPQRFVIDRASVVVSHAGAGSMIAAASAGKPHLALPIAADQWDNADLLAACDASITLELDQRDAETIRQSVERLLDDAVIGAAARAIQTEFAEMPEPSEVVAAVEDLI